MARNEHINPCVNPSEDYLVELLKSDGESAFTAIYNNYWKKLLCIAINKVKDIEEAEEIVQDVFVSLWERRHTIKLEGPLVRYLSIAVKYLVIKALAKKVRQKAYVNDRLRNRRLGDNTTQEWLGFEELRTQLEALTSRLPERCRLVYSLSRERGFSQKQIAEEMGITEKTVEAHLGKALKMIRKGLTYYFLLALLSTCI